MDIRLSRLPRNGARRLAAFLAVCATTAAPATVRYVNTNSAHASPPYLAWTSSATSLQEAIDACEATGDIVLATDGVYSVGGRVDIGCYEYPAPVSAIPTHWLAAHGLPIDGNSDGIAIHWQSVTGVIYTVERGTHLDSPSPFSAIASNIAGQADSTTHTDATAVGTGLYLYRIHVQQWACYWRRARTRYSRARGDSLREP